MGKFLRNLKKNFIIVFGNKITRVRFACELYGKKIKVALLRNILK